MITKKGVEKMNLDNGIKLSAEFNDVNQNLVILMEECAETIKVASKILRFGIDNFSPSEDKLNFEVLEQEIGDVQAMVDILVENNIGISKEGIEEARQKKIRKLIKYYKEAVNIY